MERPTFVAEKMYTYIRGYATGCGMKQTLCALSFARDKHTGQLRKSGEPYLVHPLIMACHTLSLGIQDDIIIATMAGTNMLARSPLKANIIYTASQSTPLTVKLNYLFCPQRDIL